MIGSLAQKPRCILINRTPLTGAATYATVQDADRFRVACKVYNRDTIIEGFKDLGYRCVDLWDAVELSFKIPLYPHLSVPFYSGAFFVADSTCCS